MHSTLRISYLSVVRRGTLWGTQYRNTVNPNVPLSKHHFMMKDSVTYWVLFKSNNEDGHA